MPPTPDDTANLPKQLQDSLGTTYALQRELGGGGMARVFLARDTSLDRAIVVKVLPPDMASGVSTERFRREIKVAARLAHPNIVPVLSAGEAGGIPYYTMPFVEGDSLRARLTALSEDGQVGLPIDELVRLLRDVARALAYAHGHGVIHRDIKPGNILVVDGAALVTDFGVAKALVASTAVAEARVATDTETALGVALGTPAYMAPEQVAADPAIDGRADLYALGAMAYEMLTGRPPFAGRSIQQILMAHVVERPRPVAELRNDAPPALATLVMRCLAKDPADRPQNAADVLGELDELSTGSVKLGAVRASETSQSSAPIQSSIPWASGTLLGRERDLAMVRDLLARADVRLISLTGTGGSGKTRFALELTRDIAPQFAGGVAFVQLAPVADIALIPSAIAATLGAREREDRSAIESVAARIGSARVLLVLDNFEHLLAGASVVTQLLAACPNLVVIVTSRSRLHLRGEHELLVSPLALPEAVSDDASALRGSPAVSLFLQRWHEGGADVAEGDDVLRVIAQICARLDGLPLAIELAAARCRMLAPRAILRRLEAGIDLLSGGARDLPERHQTLRATIAWSVDLLTPDERDALSRLSVCAGGCDIPTAAALLQMSEDQAVDIVQRLFDANLVRSTPDEADEPRIEMLETIRSFSRDVLRERGTLADAHARHTTAFLAFAERLSREFGHAESLRRFERELDNVRVALDWNIGEAGDRSLAARLAALSWRFWLAGARLREGDDRLSALLAHPELGAPTKLRAELLLALATIARNMGEFARLNPLLEESLVIERALGDAPGQAAVLIALGWSSWIGGDSDAADAFSEEALALCRSLGDRSGEAYALNNLGWVAHHRGDFARAADCHGEAAAIRRTLGDRRGLATSLANVARALGKRGQIAEALALHDEAQSALDGVGDKQVQAYSLTVRAETLLEAGDSARAEQLVLDQALPLFRRTGHAWGTALALTVLSDAATARRDRDGAVRAAREALALRRRIGDRTGERETMKRLDALELKT